MGLCPRREFVDVLYICPYRVCVCVSRPQVHSTGTFKYFDRGGFTMLQKAIPLKGEAADRARRVHQVHARRGMAACPRHPACHHRPGALPRPTRLSASISVCEPRSDGHSSTAPRTAAQPAPLDGRRSMRRRCRPSAPRAPGPRTPWSRLSSATATAWARSGGPPPGSAPSIQSWGRATPWSRWVGGMPLVAGRWPGAGRALVGQQHIRRGGPAWGRYAYACNCTVWPSRSPCARVTHLAQAPRAPHAPHAPQEDVQH